MSKAPIFIIGCPRSGTTLVRVILDTHPNICCGPETHLIKHMKTMREQIIQKWDMLKPYGVDLYNLDKTIKNILTIFMDQYVKQKHKKRWAEKTPDNIFYADFINELFPDCQFINVIRDGRDVISSFKERWGSKTIFTAIKTWNKSVEMTLLYRNKFQKSRYMEIRYEDLVTIPEQQTKILMEFLGEEWNPALLEHYKSNHDFWFDFSTQFENKTYRERQPQRHSPSQPVFSSSVGNWKIKLNVLEKILTKSCLQKNLTILGYV